MRHMAVGIAARFVAKLVLVSYVSLSVSHSAIADSARMGIEKRVVWTTSRIMGSPEPPLPYVTERAFPALKFNQCLDIVSAPGSGRLYVVEQSGKILSFPNQSELQVLEGDVGVAFFSTELSVLSKLTIRGGRVTLGNVSLGELDKTAGELIAEESTLNGALTIRG